MVCGIQFIGGDCYYGGVFDILVVFLYFFIEFLFLMGVNFVCCYYYQWYVFYWFVFCIDELVIDGNYFYVIVMCFGDNC